VVIPGINPVALADLNNQVSGSGMLTLLDIFSGGAFSNASVFALGIMPYISASIVIQLLGIIMPYFQKLQKEGESGRRKMNQWTRYLTIIVLIMQGSAYITNLHTQIPAEAFVLGGTFFTAVALMCLTAGTMFTMWLGEKITDKGIGNGVSLIIMVGIIARLPFAFWSEVTTKFGAGSPGGIVMLVVELVLLYLIFMASIALVQAVRKIPVQYAKRIVGNKQYGGVRQYIPLKVNAAGVMPIIFAQALMFIPMLFQGVGGGKFAAAFSYESFWYNVTFFLLVIAFTYFYTAITVNPTMMAEDMKRNGGFIPGTKPGKATAAYIDDIMTRITLPGSIFIAIIAILPTFAAMLGINQQFSYFFGGTSLLILVGVVLDTLKQIESYLLMRHYDGLMKTGRLKGRSGS
jgi:preprotein translocase subunit SecY